MPIVFLFIFVSWHCIFSRLSIKEMSVVSNVDEDEGENVIITNDNDILLDSEEDNRNDQQT